MFFWLQATELIMANRVKEGDLLHDYLERYWSNEALTNYISKRKAEQLQGPQGTAIEAIHLS